LDFEDPLGYLNRGETTSGTDMYHGAKFHADQVPPVKFQPHPCGPQKSSR